MPVFSFTPQQFRALEALGWLYDESDNHRREGRTTILAFHSLRQIVMKHINGDNGWVTVHDHHPNRITNEMMVGAIVNMARGFLGVGLIEDRRGGVIRLRLEEQELPWVAIERNLFELGQIEAIPTVESEPEKEEERTTLWEHLRNPEP